ncbi:MAG: SlyX family protein [Opitutales bacterium]
MNDERIQLELKVTFLEKTVAELSEALYDQQKQIERLETRFTRLEERLKALAEGEDPGGHQRPPHY